MTRILTLLVIGYFLWQFVKNFLNKQELQSKRQAERKQQGAIPIVKCEQCKLHLPQNEAIASGSHWFCCSEHKSLWLKTRR